MLMNNYWGKSNENPDYWRPDAVGNVGNPGYPVWPPGITGLKITYGSPYPGAPYWVDTVPSFFKVPYVIVAPMYIGFPHGSVYGFPQRPNRFMFNLI